VLSFAVAPALDKEAAFVVWDDFKVSWLAGIDLAQLIVLPRPMRLGISPCLWRTLDTWDTVFFAIPDRPSHILLSWIKKE
jgi:hypothetical protein